MKMVLLIVSVALCSLLATGVEGINGGRKAQLGEFKYVVGIDIVKSGLLPFGLSDQTFTCGGAIIGEKYILSAGHCFADRTDKKDQAFEFKRHKVIVYANTLGLDKKHLKKSHVIKRIAVNVYFMPKFFKFGVPDIAVLELNEELHVEKNQLEIVKLPERKSDTTAFDDYSNNEVSLIGYGKDVVGKTDNELKHMFAKVVDVKKCHIIANADHERFICADGVAVPLSACEGDSGSPLIHEVKKGKNHKGEVQRTVIGVMSLGLECTKHEKHPNLFSRVSLYEQFIADAMKWTKNTDVIVKHTYLKSLAMKFV